MADEWLCGGLIWVPGEHPAETILEVAGVGDAIPVGYRTREDVTSGGFACHSNLRAVFREADFTFLVEPERLRNGSFGTLEPLSEAFGRAWGLSLDDSADVATAGAARGGAMVGWIYAEGSVRDLNGISPDLDLEAAAARDVALSLLERSVGRTLAQLVFEGTLEQAGATDDPWIAAVLDHEPVAEVFQLERR